MSEPKKNIALLAVSLALWALAFGWSVLGFAVLTPTSDSLGRGVNLWMNFLGWQGIAACLALVCFGLARGWPKGSGIRKVARLPLWCAGALVLLIGAYLLWAIATPG